MSLVSQLQSVITRIGTELKTTKTLIAGNGNGDLSGLSTSAKGNIVAAINEVKSSLDTITTTVNKNRGYFATSAALIAAIPAGTAGDYAVVGATDTVWIWDTDGTPQWRDGDTKGSVTSVNGQSGAVVIGNATGSVAGLMSPTDYTKLSGIASGATQNSTDAVLKDRANHTGTQLATTISNFAATVLSTILAGLSTATGSIITTADSVLVALGKLQAQITAHNGVGGATHPNAVAGGNAGFMSGADKTKLDGIATGANNYAHPSGDGNLHIPATGTTNNLKVLKSGSTAGSAAWDVVNFSELGNKPTTIAGYGLSDVYSKTETGDPATDFVAVFNTAIA
jgi:hypothetical protein